MILPIAIVALLPAAVFAGQENPGTDGTGLAAKADGVRATAAEMSFKRIPWVTDLFEGFRLARKERRPVFLYMITGDPLDDC